MKNLKKKNKFNFWIEFHEIDRIELIELPIDSLFLPTNYGPSSCNKIKKNYTMKK